MTMTLLEASMCPKCERLDLRTGTPKFCEHCVLFFDNTPDDEPHAMRDLYQDIIGRQHWTVSAGLSR